MDDILELNTSEIKDILGIHIKLNKNNWSPYRWWNALKSNNKQEYDLKMKELNNSKTILDFLINIPYIDSQDVLLYI